MHSSTTKKWAKTDNNKWCVTHTGPVKPWYLCKVFEYTVEIPLALHSSTFDLKLDIDTTNRD